MDDFSVEIMLFVMATGFVAAFIDAVVGGGGMITIPGLMMTGMPMVEVLATNKFASVMGAFCSMVSFMRSGKVSYAIIKWLFPLSFIGSIIGVVAVQLVPSDFLRPLVIVMLVGVTIYSIFKKEWGRENRFSGMTQRKWLLSGLFALLMGFYDGFFGPGTGSFILFGFLCIGFDFVMAAGNARALNFASNLAAAIAFGMSGCVNYIYAVPMGITMIVGAYFGAKLAINKGSSYVRPLFIIVSTVLIGKQLYDMLK